MFDIDNKNFTKDLEHIINKLKKHENFAFSKYADGELHILANKPINNGEFWFVPAEHADYRKKMIDSFKFKNKNYYIGIACPCCIGGPPVHNWMKNVCQQDDSNVHYICQTYPNIDRTLEDGSVLRYWIDKERFDLVTNYNTVVIFDIRKGAGAIPHLVTRNNVDKVRYSSYEVWRD